MQNYNYNDYMQMMNIPNQYLPMMEMPQDQLHTMFPRCYHVIMPEVVRMCDRMCAQYGLCLTQAVKCWTPWSVILTIELVRMLIWTIMILKSVRTDNLFSMDLAEAEDVSDAIS